MPSNFHLSEGASYVLKSLREVGPNHCLQMPENKWWQRSFAELVEHELAEEIFGGYVALTPAGRLLAHADETRK